MTIDNELIDNLLKGYKKPEDLIGENGLLKQLTKQLLERAMAAELTEHVGYEKHEAAGDGSGNSRNGTSAKTIRGTFGTLPIEVPRDRNGTFEPQIVSKHQRRFTGFDDNIISLYARGLSTREIQQHLEEIYQVEVSPGLISSVTDEVIDEVKTWQNRQLDEVYPIMYLDQGPVQGAGRGARHEQSGLSGNWRQYGRTEGSAGAVDSRNGRCEVLAASSYGVEE